MRNNKERKNQLKYFYQILSDMKNNIDTLICDLYANRNNLEEFSKSKPTVLKSKYPDLKKLGILSKTDKWEITQLGQDLLEIYEKEDVVAYSGMIASILGTYNYNGFRPYAVLCKFLYNEFGVNTYLNRNKVIEFLSLPISEAIYFITNSKKTILKDLSIKEKKEEASRPYSYWVNHLKNAKLIEEDSFGLKLTHDVEEFLDIFFTDIESLPKYKKEEFKNKYRILSRGTDQISFRNELLEVYHEKCALTGSFLTIKNSNLLEAAHIIPVSHGGSYDISNGILMTPNLHKAFDLGVFTFDDDYNIIKCENIKEKDFLPKQSKVKYLPQKKEYRPSLISINYHKDHIFGIGILSSKK